ncbi:MAG: matrixin family metalloprotease, partial [Myxococcota bacterium]|nr:matrixin family metalloprotease [Myxococcota bacterium]
MVLLVVALPASAPAYEFATDTGDASGNPLRWPPNEEVRFTQHIQGEGNIPVWRLQAEIRKVFQTWSELPEANLRFVEDPVFVGTPCPHALPAEADPQEVCGGATPDYDFQSALFFIQTVWPFGEEVIALTTLSWQEGGTLVDADISFNAIDYDWTVDSDEVVVDYRSIALHEVGHFVGLAHSNDPTAVMWIDYDEGDLGRELAPDDRAGIAESYPCNNPPCGGEVAYPDPTCSVAGPWSGRGLLLFLTGLGLLGLLYRTRRYRSGLLLLGVGLLVLWPSSPHSSTVLALDIDELTLRADRVVR